MLVGNLGRGAVISLWISSLICTRSCRKDILWFLYSITAANAISRFLIQLQNFDHNIVCFHWKSILDSIFHLLNYFTTRSFFILFFRDSYLEEKISLDSFNRPKLVGLTSMSYIKDREIIILFSVFSYVFLGKSV